MNGARSPIERFEERCLGEKLSHETVILERVNVSHVFICMCKCELVMSILQLVISLSRNVDQKV